MRNRELQRAMERLRRQERPKPTPAMETEDERARTDSRFANWLKASRGATRTLMGKL